MVFDSSENDISIDSRGISIDARSKTIAPNVACTIFYATYPGQIYRLPRSGDTSILIAGGAQHENNLDGVGTGANFAGPYGTIVSKDGKTLYVTASYAIRAIDLVTQNVITIAGPTFFAPGCTDGSASNARFHTPRGMDISPDGTYLLVTSQTKHIIRKVSLGPISSCHCEECPSGQCARGLCRWEVLGRGGAVRLLGLPGRDHIG